MTNPSTGMLQPTNPEPGEPVRVTMVDPNWGPVTLLVCIVWPNVYMAPLGTTSRPPNLAWTRLDPAFRSVDPAPAPSGR